MDSVVHTYSFGGRLDLRWRALQYIGHYAEPMRQKHAARREVGMSLCALLRRAIARSETQRVVRAYTCINSAKLPVCAFIEVYTEGSQDRTQAMQFRNIFYFELLDHEILSAASSIVRLLYENFCTLLRKKKTHVPCCAHISK